MPYTIGIIAEGPTDIAVIESLVSGITGTPDNNFARLKPKTVMGKTDPSQLSNWSQVLAYCSSSEFRDAFHSQIDFVVIQIDTDQYDRVHFNIPDQENGKETTPMRKHELAKEIIVSRIGEQFYDSVRERIIFAICVESVECWLLPLYFSSVPAKRKKTKRCLETLISHEDGRSLEKSYAWYQKLSKHYRKERAVREAAPMNISLGRFVTEVDACLAQLPEA